MSAQQENLLAFLEVHHEDAEVGRVAVEVPHRHRSSYKGSKIIQKKEFTRKLV